MPEEDLDSIDVATAAMHEMFLSYMRAGFKRREALELIKVHLGGLDLSGEAHDES